MDTRTELPRIRQQRGMSAAQLAALAGVSRQTIYAIEGGEYIPNTTLALQLARLLEVRVEDLFRLEGEAPPPPKPISVELLGDGARQGQAVQLCHVGRRLIGVAAAPQPMLPFADGVVVGVSGARGPERVDVQVFPNDEPETKRILAAGCDPGISLLAQPLAKAGGVEMIVAPSSSQRALEWLKDGLVHVAGTHLRDGSTGEYNLAVIGKLFPKGGVKVVTFAIWERPWPSAWVRRIAALPPVRRRRRSV